jgi:hypothetical protein
MSKPVASHLPHADAARTPARPRLAVYGPDDSGRFDRVCALIGSNRRVVICGPLSHVLERELRLRQCEVAHAGSTSALLERALSGDSSSPGGKPHALERSCTSARNERLDVLLLADPLARMGETTGLLQAIAPWFRSGGFVVADIAANVSPPVRLAAIEGHSYAFESKAERPVSRETIVRLFEDAGYAMSHIQVDEEPDSIASTFPRESELSGDDLRGDLVSTAECSGQRILCVAHPLSGPELEWVRSVLRKAAEEKGAAVDEARELRAQVSVLTHRLTQLEQRVTQSVHRERETRQRLLKAHEHLAIGDAEFRSITRLLIAEREESEARLNKIIDEVATHRDKLEQRLCRLRRTLPGRVYTLCQSVMARIRR